MELSAMQKLVINLEKFKTKLANQRFEEFS
jgi:hypothetical protein